MRRTLGKIFRVTGLAAVVAVAFSHFGGEPVHAGDLQTMSVNGRTFDLYTSSAAAGRAAPLILALHGGTGNAESFRKQIPLLDMAEQRGWNVAYLNGTPMRRVMQNRLVWNAGRCCGAAVENNVNDVGYMESVISALVSRGQADPNRVWLVGHSNGAMMSYRFACERNSMIRGVIAIAGPLATESCRNASGVRVLHIHGTSDDQVPIEGGAGAGMRDGRAHRGLNATVSMLEGAGATVTVRLVDGAEHRVSSVDRAARRQLGGDLPSVVANFVDG